MAAEAVPLDADGTVVTRAGAPNFAVMSEAELDSWRETPYLLGSPANAAHLTKSLEDLEAGGGQVRTLVPVGSDP